MRQEEYDVKLLIMGHVHGRSRKPLANTKQLNDGTTSTSFLQYQNFNLL